MSAIPKTSAHFSTTLSAAISSTDTTMVLVSAADRAGNALSGLYGFVLDRGSASEEFVLGTVSGTTVTISTRGLDPQDGKTQRSSLQQPHRRGATVELTDYPLLAILARLLNGDETIPNKLSYASHPSVTSAQDIPDKQYVDTLGTGHATYDQNIISGTAGETLAAGNVVYLKLSDARWYLATQATASTCIGVRLGIAQGAATVGTAVTILIGGRDANQSALTPGSDYYLSSSGTISTSAGATNEVFVGRADAPTTLIFDPEFSKALLGNNTDIPVGSGNKLVTQTGFQKQAESYAASSGSSTNTIAGNPTITIASPAVITLSAHGLHVGDAVQFTTTGALPTGITASTTYYVISAGLTANAFEIAATPGGTAINTSGTQSGTHTAARPANNYTVTLAPVPISYAAGMPIRFKANFANTGDAMVNVNGLGSVSIRKNDGATALAANDIKNGQLFAGIYDGTNIQMVSQLGNAATGATYKNGVTSRSSATASGSQTIAHGLGTTPKYVRLTARLVVGSGTLTALAISDGTYNGSTTATVYSLIVENNTNDSTSDTTNGIFLGTDNTRTNTQAAVVTFDATNITLTWTKSGTPASGTIFIMWEAIA